MDGVVLARFSSGVRYFGDKGKPEAAQCSARVADEPLSFAPRPAAQERRTVASKALAYAALGLGGGRPRLEAHGA